MLNSEPPTSENQDDAVARVVTSGPIGAAALAGLATAIMVAIWLGFYFLVFVPRSVP
jgi:asparagine N-glycosylation enzyme membrane subunit Stt3